MNKSRSLTISSYQEQVSRILGKIDNPEKTINQDQKPLERLTLNQIQNITSTSSLKTGSMIRQKKVHGNNMGIIASIKGKMYCLKLGEVSKPKKPTDFFYSTQYRKRFVSQQKSIRML